MRAFAALLALMFAGAPPAASAATDLVLTPQKPVARSIDAYPRIAAPATEETAKINADLAKGDARVKNAARDCNNTDADNATQWRRAVSSPFRYGDLLTLAAADEWACVAFSGSSTSVLTYDLTTGAPVEWRKFFLPRVAGDMAEGVAGDTSKLSLLASPILNEVYRRKVMIGMGAEDRAACADAFQSDYFLMLWPDAEREGVAMRGMRFPRAAAACAQEVVLTLDELALLKADPGLIESIKAAHAAHAWSADLRPANGRPKPAAQR